MSFGFVLVRVRKGVLAHDMLRSVRGGSPLGNGNCEAARSEAGMSYELCIVRTVRARKGARWVGVLEYRVPPVVYRGGSLLGMQLFVCVLFPYPRTSTKTSQRHTLAGFRCASILIPALRGLCQNWPLGSDCLIVLVPGRLPSTTPRDRTSRNCPRDEYGDATTYDSCMNPEPGFRAGPGDPATGDLYDAT